MKQALKHLLEDIMLVSLKGTDQYRLYVDPDEADALLDYLEAHYDRSENQYTTRLYRQDMEVEAPDMSRNYDLTRIDIPTALGKSIRHNIATQKVAAHDLGDIEEAQVKSRLCDHITQQANHYFK